MVSACFRKGLLKKDGDCALFWAKSKCRSSSERCFAACPREKQNAHVGVLKQAGTAVSEASLGFDLQVLFKLRPATLEVIHLATFCLHAQRAPTCQQPHFVTRNSSLQNFLRENRPMICPSRKHTARRGSQHIIGRLRNVIFP